MKMTFAAIAAAFVLTAGVSFPVVAQQCAASAQKTGTQCVCTDKSQCDGGKCKTQCAPCNSGDQTCSKEATSCQSTRCGSDCPCSVTSCKK